jgi:hypothetical protein
MFFLPAKKVLCSSALLCLFSSLGFAEDKKQMACEIMGKGSSKKEDLNILPELSPPDTCMAKDIKQSKALEESKREASILSLEADNIMDPHITLFPADNSMDPKITLWEPKPLWRMKTFRYHKHPLPGEPHPFWQPDR